MRMRIVVVIPTYNEAQNVPSLASTLFALPLELQLLFVDDASPDGTGRIIDDLAREHPGRVHVLHRTGKLGFSSAYLEGFRYALDRLDSEAIGQMDADFSHDPERLVPMVECLEHFDMVIGSRYIPGGRVDERWPIWRKGLSAWANLYARTILGLPARDVTTGYRLWKRTTLAAIPLGRIHSEGYVFIVEMAYLAHCLGFTIGEVPIYFADRRFGKSKMSFRIQVEAAFRVWQMLWMDRDLRRPKHPD
jgi:dolichol-phosphate mannosyltransferase